MYKHKDRFEAQTKVDGKLVTIGTYDTAVEAAVAYAKHAAGEIVVEPRVQPEVEVEVKEAEGYELFVSPRSATGYMGVTKENGRFKAFKAQRMVDGKNVSLGYYDTAVKAAVAYAKHVAASAGSSSAAAAPESPEPPAQRRRLSTGPTAAASSDATINYVTVPAEYISSIASCSAVTPTRAISLARPVPAVAAEAAAPPRELPSAYAVLTKPVAGRSRACVCATRVQQ